MTWRVLINMWLLLRYVTKRCGLNIISALLKILMTDSNISASYISQELVFDRMTVSKCLRNGLFDSAR